MKMLTRFQFFRLVFLCLIACQGISSAQSLYDVVISISDRQRVLNQQSQVDAYLWNQNNAIGATDEDLPPDYPIDWIGVGTSPTQPAVDGLDIGGKSALLNQAVVEFARLKFAFFNCSPEEFNPGSTVGSIKAYSSADFDPLPRATPENYQGVLRVLAQRVRALRLIQWPAAFVTSSFSDNTSVSEQVDYHDPDDSNNDGNREPYVKIVTPPGINAPASVAWTPDSIGPGNLDLKIYGSYLLITTYLDSQISVDGSYSERPSGVAGITAPLRTEYIDLSGSYPEDATISATAPGAGGTQIDGTVYVLRRSAWNQIDIAAAPPRFAPNEAGYVVEGSGNSGSISLFDSPPSVTINGSWATTYNQSESNGQHLRKSFVEGGYQYREASLLPSSDPGHSDNYGNSYERNWQVGCTFYSVFKPTFTRGVDATDIQTKLEVAAGMLADNSADGEFLLHPRPGLLFGIHLGPGVKGAGNGYVFCNSAKTCSDDWYYDYDYNYYGWDSYEWNSIIRFDSSYSLQFAGSCSDYHVVYENDRSNRSQSLPADSLGWPFTDSDNVTSYDTLTLYRAWDRPRLKQVAGRDLVANFDYNSSHYGGYTVKIYRRPKGNTTPTPGQALDISGMTLIRTWTFSHPGAGTTAHPTDAEKLLATGSGGEKYEIQANEALPYQGRGVPDWWYDSLNAIGFYGYGWWTTEGTDSWALKYSQDSTEKLKKDIEITNTVNEDNQTTWSITLRESVDGQLFSTLSSRTLDPFSDGVPKDWEITSAGKTITGTATCDNYGAGSGYGKWPSSVSIQYDGLQPDADYSWDDNGLLASMTQGPWSTTGTMDGTAYKQTHQFNGTPYGTTWTELTGANKIKTFSSPDGSSTSKDSSSVAWTAIEYGTATAGLPDLPLTVRNSDGSGTTYDWSFISPSNSQQLTITAGHLGSFASVVDHGTKVIQTLNERGCPTETQIFAANGGTVQTSGTTFSDVTTWGFPTKSTDSITGLSAAWGFDSNLSRLSSLTTGIGTASTFSGYDALGRPASVSHNDITAAITHTGFSTQSIISGAASGIITDTRDALGRPTAFNTTWNGVTDDLSISRSSTATDSTRSTLLGTYESSIRSDDGSLATASGPTLPLGGDTGTAMTVDNGLFKTTTALSGQSAKFQTTWTDAWGRVRKITTPNGDTQFLYTDPDSSLQSVRTTEPSGRRLITDSDPYNSAGAITRSGIDVNQDGTLDTSDRYVQTITTASSGSIVTTLSLTENSGLREILKTIWTPAANLTITRINGGEEEINRVVSYLAKTVTTTSTKGWSKTESFNNLGLTTSSTLSGSGIPAANLSSTWRADSSLESVSLTINGETHSASFKNDGTLASLTAPGRGNILQEHSISNGNETLTVDNTTLTRKLDGTQQTTTGSDAPAKTEALAVSGSGFTHITTPAIGAATETVINAAGATTAKNYAAGAGESRQYLPGGLLEKITLARGGDLTFGYSNDGAKDLTTATWPAVASGPFTLPTITQGYGYDRAGRVDEIGDSSGVRALAYQNGRLAATTYTSGTLSGYKILRGHDTAGRETGFKLWRGNRLIHSAQKAPNGVSGEVSELASGNFKVIINRNSARQITGFEWGNASGTFTPTVTQTWQRGSGGRILLANSSVGGAPSFDYRGTANDEATSFDTKGRRLKVKTAGADWTYQYTNGQLTSATHPTLGTFSYQVDAIGRRTDQGSTTSDSLLNQTLAWTNSQNKTLKITAAPTARLWVGIDNAAPTEIPSFTGAYNYSIPSPGASGGWVPWNTLAVLEGEGDAGASADAKAEQSGAVWVPPTNEDLTYDAAGNRESSAQWDYGWNAKNEPTRARTKNYNSAPQGYDITNAFDAESRRFQKRVNCYQNGQIVEQNVITFLYDGNDIIYERQQLPSGYTTLERRYLWGPDISGTQGEAGGAGGLLLIRETKGNETIDLYPLYDGTGNVIALTDNTGTLQAEYAYGPFGETIYARGPKASSCPFRFATKYLDQETGLYNFGKRFLDPITGQWTSRESLGESESLNLYAYCHNNPIGNVDRLGLEAVAVEATLTDGIPTIIYEEWAGSGLAYMWNALAAGKVKTWSQSPDSGQLGRCFYQEDGVWHLRSAEGRHNAGADEALAAIPAEMENIKPVMDTFEIGGAALASLPFAAIAGSAEVGGALLVYGETQLASISATTFTLGGTAMLGSGTAVTLGDAITVGSASWLFGTESGHEWGSRVGSSGFSAPQTAGLFGLDAVGGTLSKGGSPFIETATNVEINLTLRYKLGWTDVQRAAADAKAAALTDAAILAVIINCDKEVW